jgi:uridylate kinase
MESFILSLGGSIVSGKQGIEFEFLNKFNKFIRKQISEKNRRFFIVVGGGKVCRDYQQGAKLVETEHITNNDLDWLGTHATHLNGHFLRTIFRDIAFKYVIIHYDRHYQIPETCGVIIGAGWKPGWSTDYDAVLLCKDYKVKTIINMSNTDMVYDKDPNKFPDAKPLKKVSWQFIRDMVGDEWTPGLNTPFDPVAAKLCQKNHYTVVTLNGKNLENLENCLNKKNFIGTTIS